MIDETTENMLSRIETGISGNDVIVINEFSMRGIDAIPRVDTFTYRAWVAKGRQVRKGEHGVKIPVYIRMEKKGKKPGDKPESYTRPRSTTVFHKSQTDPID